MREKTGSMARPKRYKPPEVDESTECVDAWKALIEEEGYPMTCTGVVAQAYFSAGFRAAKGKKARKPTPPSKVPE